MALPRYASTSLALQGNQYVSLGNNGLGGLTSFTAEVWVLPTKLSGTQSVLSQFDRGTGTGTFQVYLDDGALFVAIPGKAPLEAGVPIALDQ